MPVLEMTEYRAFTCFRSDPGKAGPGFIPERAH